MNQVFVVVLIVGAVIIASIFFRRRGYSPNQRIVLSGIAGVLLLWTGRGHIMQNPANAIFYVAGAALLIYAAMFLRPSE